MSKKTKNMIKLGVVALLLIVVYVSVFVFNLKPKLGLDLKGGISLVLEAQGKKVDADVLAKTVEKIRERVDRLGVTEPEISTQGTRNVIVQLPGIHDTDRAKEIVGKTAQLQFRLVTETKEEKEVKDDAAWAITTGEENLMPDKAIILAYKPEKTKYRAKLGETLLKGDAIKEAQVTYASDTGDPQVSFTLTNDGKSKFAEITKANINKQLAIVLDYEIESAPNIQGEISEGKGEITGKFTEKEAKDLAIVLNTGALPVDLKLINEQDVTATLGRDSLRKAIIAGLIGLAIVAVYMILFYRAFGLLSLLALGVFAALFYGFICLFGEFWSLTLAGIAGIIVSIGTAADSGVVYFERLKEDLRAGRTLNSSADRAYKKAFRTIIAADTVTFMSAAVLYLVAVGSVKGFAFTLGMATLFDIFISWFFVHPVVSLLANWKLMGKPAAIGVRHLQAEAVRGGAK